MTSADFLWNAAPSGLQLADGNVHVFCAPLDVPAKRQEELGQWLSLDEWHRAKRFQRERDRQRFIVGRGTLREILGGLQNVEPASFVFSYGEFGKPRISAPTAAHSLHFNLAHSDSIAVYATAKHELGVDLERICVVDEADQIASRFFSPHEANCLRALPAQQRQEAFFNCWTRKEAHLKAMGLGLADGFEQIEISSTTGATPELAGIIHDSTPWLLHTLVPAPEFVGAMAIQQEGARVNCWNWNRLP